jgi:DNA-binding response OmpR family regulator/GGDEF domain-containing protein
LTQDGPPPDDDLQDDLRELWEASRGAVDHQLSALEAAAGAALRGDLSGERRQEGKVAAHQLAGCLGSFGFHDGTRIARQIEALLEEGAADPRALSEAVVTLRETVLAAPPVQEAPLIEADAERGRRLLVVSDDLAYTQVLEREARALGLRPRPFPHPIPPALGGDVLAVVLDLDDGGEESLARILRKRLDVPLVAVTDAVDARTRTRLLDAGAFAVFRRTDNVRHVLRYVARALGGDGGDPSVAVLVVAPDEGSRSAITRSLAGEAFEIVVTADAESSWQALLSTRFDVAVLSWTAPDPDVARLLRTDPRWSALPLVAVTGSWSQEVLDSIVGAGAIAARAVDGHVPGLRTCVRSVVAHADRLTRFTEFDPHTGCDRWEHAERTVDRMLRIGERGSRDVVVAQVEVDCDPPELIASGAVRDLLAHRVAHQLRRTLRGEDVIARSGERRLVLALYSCPAGIAARRLLGARQALESVLLTMPDGTQVAPRMRVGVTYRPHHGADLPALLRACELALTATTAEHPILEASAERTVPAQDRQATGAAPQERQVVVDVVVVEDDPAVASLINHALGLRDLTSLLLSDGSEAALALCSGEVVCRLVLLDIGLPGLDGFGVLSRLGRAKVLDRTKVIVLTARYQEAETLRAFDLGATDHMTKPFSIPVLLNRIEQALRRQRP